MPADASEVVISPLRHVSGLGADLNRLTPEQLKTLRSFERALRSNKMVAAHADYVTDAVLVRFLIAQVWCEEKAVKMIGTALDWRSRRPCHRWILAHPSPGIGPPALLPDAGRAERMRAHSSTGKIRVSGTDRYGRPVMVLDNARENSTDANELMEFLAFNMELCQRTALLAGKGADKIMLFLHMTEFSMFNQPPMSVTKETIMVMSTAFPESLGTAVIYNPPVYFTTFWNLVTPFIDPNTKAKVIFMRGDISDGSSNDKLMKTIIGDNWKVLTGSGQPVVAEGYSMKRRKNIPSSPGFDIARYWPTVLSREEAYANHLASRCRTKASCFDAQPSEVVPGKVIMAQSLSEPQSSHIRSLTMDLAVVSMTVPSFLWLLGHSTFWQVVRSVPSGFSSPPASLWAAEFAEFAVLVLVLLFAIQLTSLAMGFTTVDGDREDVDLVVRGAGDLNKAFDLIKLILFAAFFIAALAVFSPSPDTGGQYPRDGLVAAVTVFRTWSPHVVALHSGLLLVRSRSS